MIPPDHRVIMIIIRQISSRHAQLELTITKINLDATLKMCLVDDRDCNSPVGVLESSHEQIFSAAACADANRPWTCEAEVPCESPETARHFKAIVGEANEDGVASGCRAGVVLGTPPVEIAGGVAVDERVVPVSSKYHSCHGLTFRTHM